MFSNKVFRHIGFRILVALICVPLQANLAMSAEQSKSQIRKNIAQKLMLDMRYFCHNDDDKCREPMTVLPESLAEMIEDSGLGGVILFSENLRYPNQIAALTGDMQKAALASKAGQPLFIAIDQEGGRVFRTPRVFTTDFAGNMAIGATEGKHGTRFATESGKILAQELKALGINTNFAPNVDVNANLENPVINVRSFGQDPKLVAEMGEAQVKAMQGEGVLATLKHFPGHGDTHTDSHLALPVVDHSRQMIDAVDLYPFKQIIAKAKPAMVMTAHIQYPQLDSSTLKDRDGNPQIKPATLSHKILTGILRDELNFDGIIVSDAMNMAGIAKFFDQTDAVAASFAAGADVVVMPLPMHNEKDIKRFNKLLDALVKKVQKGELDGEQIARSAERIRATKQTFGLATWPAPAPEKLAANLADNKQKAQALADAAIAALSGTAKDYVIPAGDKVLVLMPEMNVCSALEYHLSLYRPKQQIMCMSLQQINEASLKSALEQADSVVVGSMTPTPSLVELGGMEDMAANQQQIIGFDEAQAMLPGLFDQVQASGKRSILVYLRMPYDKARLDTRAGAVLATYNANVYALSDAKDARYTGGTMESLARVLIGLLKPTGGLPVSLTNSVHAEAAPQPPRFEWAND